MITKEYAKGLTEVMLILDNTETEYIDKIPEKIRKSFAENADKDYIPNFDPKVTIKEMNLLQETKDILSVIYLNYWAESQEEKEQFYEILNQNQKKLDEEKREKYHPDKIFDHQPEIVKNATDECISSEPVRQEEYLTVYPENIFHKFILKVKEWIRKFKK